MYLSVVIPTYNEKKNIGELVSLISAGLAGLEYEIIFVDDNSPDGTGREIEGLSGKYPIQAIHRKGKLGLSSAVVEWFKIASGSLLCIMDADLSHPPGEIKKMAGCLEANRSDMVIASRFIRGSEIKNWPAYRRCMSFCARLLALPLTGVRDPLSGFFMVRKDVIIGKEINPIGYKILLEMLVKCRNIKITEYPFVFTDRVNGKTKMDGKIIFEYFMQLCDLYYYRFIKQL